MISFRQIMRNVYDSVSGSLKVRQNITTINDGSKDVSSAASRVTLVASSTPAQMVDIQAKEDNTGAVVVGGSTVVALLASRRGVALNPLASVRIYCDDLQDIYIDSLYDGDGVTFVYYT